jgi:hypothetical protein
MMMMTIAYTQIFRQVNYKLPGSKSFQAVSPFKRITNFKLELIALETLHMSDTAFKQNT